MKAENPSFAFELPARSIRVFYTSVLIIDLLLILTYLVLRSQPELPWILHIIKNQVDLTRENAAGVWYSGIILLFTGMAALVCFKMDSRGSAQEKFHSVLRFGWLAIAGAFVSFSFDEMGSIHERLDKIFPQTVFSYTGGETGWVTVLWPVIAIVFGYFMCFFWFHLSKHRLSQMLALIGGSLLIAVPVQEKLEHLIAATGAKRGIYLGALEEGSEIFGTTLILVAFLEFALFRSRREFGNKQAAPLDRSRASLTIDFDQQFIRYFYFLMTVMATASLLTALYFVPRLEDLGHRGNPSAWFPTVTLFVAAALALVNFSLTAPARGVKTSFPRWIWAVLAAGSLWVSIDYQAGLTKLAVMQLAYIAGDFDFAHWAKAGMWLLLTVGAVAAAVGVGCLAANGTRVSRALFATAGFLWASLLITESPLVKESVTVVAPTLLVMCFLEALKYFHHERPAVTNSQESDNRLELPSIARSDRVSDAPEVRQPERAAM
jgi:hypothetical protein